MTGKIHNHIGCICFTFRHYDFSNVSSNRLPDKMHSCIGCIYFSPVCVFKCVLKFPALKKHSRIGCIHMTYISVRFQIWRSKVALVAFVWLFSTVCFQMSPKIACLGRSKVTLVAFLSIVHFQKYTWNVCFSGDIVALMAFVWFLSANTVGRICKLNITLRLNFFGHMGVGRCGRGASLGWQKFAGRRF